MVNAEALQRRFAESRWAVFENGTVVRLAGGGGLDEIANKAIAAVSGLCPRDIGETAAGRRELSRAEGPRWLVQVGRAGGATTYVLVKDACELALEEVLRVAAESIQGDQECLRIVSMA